MTQSSLTKIQLVFFFIKLSPGGCKLLVLFHSFEKVYSESFDYFFVAFVEG